MLFGGKNRTQPKQPSQENSLYPVLHVADSLKEYQKELVKKEVSSLSELSMVGASFAGVLREADSFQEKLQELVSPSPASTRPQSSSARSGGRSPRW